MSERNEIIDMEASSTPAAGEAAPRTAEVVALEIRTLQRQAQGIILSYAIEIGRRLEESKSMVPHGEWGAWLKKELDFSQSTAQNFMRVFREYGDNQQSLFGGVPKSQTFGNLSYSKALRLLAIPDEEERERFAAENDVEHMSIRELNEAIKARDEALKRETEAQIARNAAEAEQSRLETELRIANEKISAAQADSHSAIERADALSAELEELRSRPVEVAVQDASEEQLAQARAEAEAALRKKLDKAKADIQKAKAAQKEAEEAKDKAEAELKTVNDKLASQMAQQESAIEEAVQRAKAEDAKRTKALEKQLAAADPGIAEFKVRFAAWQAEYEKMMTLLGRISGEAQADKLKGAVKAALDWMLQAIT